MYCKIGYLVVFNDYLDCIFALNVRHSIILNNEIMRRIFALTIIVMIAAAGCGKVELRTLDGLRQEVYARPDSVL